MAIHLFVRLGVRYYPIHATITTITTASTPTSPLDCIRTYEVPCRLPASSHARCASFSFVRRPRVLAFVPSITSTPLP